METERTILSVSEVVVCARGWIGTKFVHQGRKKAANGLRGACDCLGLLVGVAQEMDLRSRNGQSLAEFDERDYGHIPDGKRLQAALDGLLWQRTVQDMQAGDVVLMRFEQAPQHLAIVGDYVAGGLSIIHALASARAVVEHGLDAHWHRRIVAVYRLAQTD